MKWKTSRRTPQKTRERCCPRWPRSYFKAGRKAADGKRSPRALHRFRIETKRFRYALELFRPLYGPSLDRRLKAVHELQDVLGKISDYQTILDMLAGDQEIGAKVRRSQKRKSKDFSKLWKAFDSGGQLKQWKAYLGRGQRSVRARRDKVRSSNSRMLK